MGTPGDKRITKLEEPEELDETGGTLDIAYVDTQLQTHQTDAATSDMTILSQHLPQLTKFIDYLVDTPLPETDKVTIEGSSDPAQTYVDPLYIESTTETAPAFTQAIVKEETFTQTIVKEETFLSDEQPGPSGLQTPKSKQSQKVNVKKAKKSQTPKKTHACPVCQKTFHSSNKLSKHQQLHGNSSPFKCEHCKKTFSSKFKLVRHVLIHSDRKPFSCSVCERTFHRKDHLKNHIKVHSPCKKLYICEKPDCKKEYTSSLSYKKHLALHAAEEGLLDCKICAKSFKTKEEILYHLKIHAGSRTVKNPEEKKYSCDYCQRKFFTRKDVRRHLVVHTGKRDFLCQFCPQRFGRKDHLVRHIKKSHSKSSTAIKSEEATKSETDEALIKLEAEESNLSNPETFSTNFDLDSLLTENLSILTDPPQQFLPHTSSQEELTDLGSEVLDEITEAASTELEPEPFEENILMNDSSIITLLQQPDENAPLPAFSQIFQIPPQPPQK